MLQKYSCFYALGSLPESDAHRRKMHKSLCKGLTDAWYVCYTIPDFVNFLWSGILPRDDNHYVSTHSLVSLCSQYEV